MPKARRSAVRALGFTAGLLFATELLLRSILHAPRGTFVVFAPGRSGLYPESSRIEMRWGPIPYTVQTNSFGFRGPEISRDKPPGTIRIATIGDSVTDGFFVDDEDTWQSVLQRGLNQGEAHPRFEVLNCAHGGGSIDKELAILRKAVLPLEPDVVILTFVTNDIWDIRRKRRPELLSYDVATSADRASFSSWLVTHTALGETLFDAYLRVRSPSFRGNESAPVGPQRYAIPGGGDFTANTKVFLSRFGQTDGLVLKAPFPAAVSTAVDN
jgi:hypothetical protein